MRKCRYELPENVVSFLREYNKMNILDSGSETRLEFEKVANEMTNGIIEDYISPAKRIDGYSNSRGIVVQIFCKKHTIGVFSYYWEDRPILRWKWRRFTSMHTNSNQLMNIGVAESVVIEGKMYEIRKNMELFQEFYYTF